MPFIEVDVSTVEIFDILTDFLVGVGLLWLSFEGHKLAKINVEKNRYDLSQDKLDVFLDNYKKINDAVYLVIQNGVVKSEAAGLLWSAYSDARLLLPKEIEGYTKDLADCSWKAFRLHIRMYDKDGNVKSGIKNFDKLLDEEEVLLDKFYKLEPHAIFRKYTKIIK